MLSVHDCALHAVALHVPSLELRETNPHKSKLYKDELEWSAPSPDLSFTEHVWDELEHWLHSRPPHTTSESDLTHTNPQKALPEERSQKDWNLEWEVKMVN